LHVILAAQLWRIELLKKVAARSMSNDTSFTQFSGECNDSYAITLAASLEWNTTLQSLTLMSHSEQNERERGWTIGDVAVAALAAALEKNTTLQELNLKGGFVEGEVSECITGSFYICGGCFLFYLI
jgi:hypothetical protein